MVNKFGSSLQCRGRTSSLESWNPSPGGIIDTGELRRILTGDNTEVDNEFLQRQLDDNTVRVDMQRQLNKLLQRLAMIETAATSVLGSGAYQGVALHIPSLRSEIAESLAIIKHSFYLLSRQQNSGSGLLYDSIIDLLLSQGVLRSLPEHLVGMSAASSDYLHVWLEVRWAVVLGAHYLPDTLPPDQPEVIVEVEGTGSGPTLTWFHQLVLGTMLDLELLTARRLSASRHMDSVRRPSAFCCTCVEEIWLCLHQLCLARSQDAARGEDFWSLLASTFSGPSTGTSLPTAVLEPSLEMLQYTLLPHQQDTGLPWNLTACLVTLFSLANQAKTGSDPAQLHRMLRSQLRDLLRSMEERLEESRLRKALQTVEVVVERTGAPFEIIADLWDFFRRMDRLNASFRGRSATIDGVACLPKTPAAWYSQLQTMLSGEHTPSCSSDPFKLFLQLVVMSCQFWSNNGAAVKVQKFSSRIGVTMRAKAGEQLSEHGLHHVATLFMILISLEKQPTLVVPLLNILKAAENRPGASRQLLIAVLRCRLTLTCCCAGSGLPLEDAAQAAAAQLTAQVNSWLPDQRSPDLRRATEDSVGMYVTALSSVVDLLGCLGHPGVGSLLADWLPLYLSSCYEHEVATILGALEKLVKRVRLQITSERRVDKLTALLDRLWELVYPALKQLATGLTSPPQVATLAAEFALLATEGGGTKAPSKETLSEMVRYFSSPELAAPGLAAVFLHAIITADTPALHHLAQESPMKDYLLENLVICCLHVGPSSQAYQGLQAAWRTYSSRLGIISADDETKKNDLLLNVIYQLTNSAYTQVLQKLCEHCTFKRQGQKELPERRYLAAGWLVKHAMSTIYSPDVSGPFHGLIASLLTPNQAFSAEWKLPQDCLAGLRSSLVNFLDGICNYSKFSEDRFLARKVKEIIKIYLPKFAVSGHPLLCLLSKPGLAIPPSHQVNLSEQVCEKALANFLTDGQQIHHTLDFLRECAVRRGLLPASLRPLVIHILPLLLNLTLREDKRARSLVAELLQAMLPGLTATYGEELDTVLTHFITTHLPHHWDRVFATLTVVVSLEPHILDTAWAQLLRLVDKIERERPSLASSKPLSQRLITLEAALNKHTKNAGSREHQRSHSDSE